MKRLILSFIFLFFVSTCFPHDSAKIASLTARINKLERHGILTVAEDDNNPRVRNVREISFTNSSLTDNGAGTVFINLAAGGGGDITDVGDGSTGAVFTEASTAYQLWFEGATSNANEIKLTSADPAGDKVITLPDITGTVIISGHSFTNDVTATLDTDASTALTIAANAVALGTDTTGNFVKDVVDGTGIDGTASGENATYTPSFDATELDALTWSDNANASNVWTFDVSGTDHTMTAGNGLMTFSHELASDKHTITSTTVPQLDIDGDTGVSNFRLRATNDTGAFVFANNAGGTRFYFEVGASVEFRNALLADMIANPAVPGDNDVLMWSLDDSGNVIGTGSLTGHSRLNVDNITINAAAITSNTDEISFDNENLTTTGNMTIGESLFHTGDVDTSLAFSPDVINLNAGGKALLRIGTTNVQIGDWDSGNSVNVSSTTGIMTFVGTAAINGLKLNIVAKTANYNITGTDDVIICGAGNQTFTVDLPSPVTGKVYHVKNEGLGIITVDANVDGGTTIDGVNTAVLTTQYECITIASNGTVYWII